MGSDITGSLKSLWNAIEASNGISVPFDDMARIVMWNGHLLNRRYGVEIDEYISLFTIEILEAAAENRDSPIQSTQVRQSAYRASYKVRRTCREQYRHSPLSHASNELHENANSPDAVVELRDMIFNISKNLNTEDFMLLELLLSQMDRKQIAHKLSIRPDALRQRMVRLRRRLRRIVPAKRKGFHET